MCEDNTAEVIRLARLGLLPEFITDTATQISQIS